MIWKSKLSSYSVRHCDYFDIAKLYYHYFLHWNFDEKIWFVVFLLWVKSIENNQLFKSQFQYRTYFFPGCKRKLLQNVEIMCLLSLCDCNFFYVFFSFFYYLKTQMMKLIIFLAIMIFFFQFQHSFLVFGLKFNFSPVLWNQSHRGQSSDNKMQFSISGHTSWYKTFFLIDLNIFTKKN